MSELASRLRRERQRSAAVVSAAAVRSVVGVEDTEESDSSSSSSSAGAGAGAVGARLQTSNVRRAVESPQYTVESPIGHTTESSIGQPAAAWVDLLKVWLAYGTLMASCSSQFIIVFPIFIMGARGLLGKTVR